VEISAHLYDNSYETSFAAVATRTITVYRPHFSLNTDAWNIPQNIKLVDPSFFKLSASICFLVPSCFFDLMCVGQIRMADSLPFFPKARLGCVVSCGCAHLSSRHSSLATLHFLSESVAVEKPLPDIAKRF